MKLLFDQNLSQALARHLADLFPNSSHVAAVGLDRASDQTIWDHARQHGFTVVSKDNDFVHIARTGSPPKAVVLQVGNVSTPEIEELIRDAFETLIAFESSTDELLFLGRRER